MNRKWNSKKLLAFLVAVGTVAGLCYPLDGEYSTLAMTIGGMLTAFLTSDVAAQKKEESK